MEGATGEAAGVDCPENSPMADTDTGVAGQTGKGDKVQTPRGTLAGSSDWHKSSQQAASGTT